MKNSSRGMPACLAGDYIAKHTARIESAAEQKEAERIMAFNHRDGVDRLVAWNCALIILR